MRLEEFCSGIWHLRYSIHMIMLGGSTPPRSPPRLSHLILILSHSFVMPAVRTAIFKRFLILTRAFCQVATTARFLAKTRRFSHISTGKMAGFGGFLWQFFCHFRLCKLSKIKLWPILNNCIYLGCEIQARGETSSLIHPYVSYALNLAIWLRRDVSRTHQACWRH
jgi:hypothetical protein